jgi:DNA-binding CsgD family transcriptional regulator
MATLDEDIVVAMNRGVLEPSPWRGFVATVRRRFGANYCNLIFRRCDLARSSETFDADPAVPSDLHMRYQAGFEGADPLDYYSMESCRAYLIDEFPQRPITRIFRDEFLAPAGLDHFMICLITEPSGVRAWLTVTRPAVAPAFDESDRRLLERIARSFAPCLATFAALRRADLETEKHARATRALGIGTILLDQHGTILDRDVQAQQILDGQAVLFAHRGRLRLRDCPEHRDLDREIARLVAEPVGSTRTASMIVGDPALELLLCSTRSRLDRVSASVPAVTIYLRRLDGLPPFEAHRIAELFKLCPREAELAGLLARGRTLKEAAIDLHITESTARTYSKRVFLKTGVRSQTDLVRRILTSVAPLARAH